MRLGSFTANIIIGGKVLEEYDVVSESPTEVTCWVASEEGKPFSVQWKCHEESRVAAARGSVDVDGIGCGSKATWPGALGVQDTEIISHFVNATSVRSLIFTRVQLSDDDSLLNKQIHKDLGKISLVIERGEIVQRPCPADNRDEFVPDDNQRLHERSKKATVHCVGFGPEKARTRSRYKWRLIRNSQPKITFVFKYQPLDILQANGIAPRPTLTNADAGIPDGHTSEDTEPVELNNRIQTLENELKRLRALEASNFEDRKPKRIKIEDSRGRRHLFASGEIIDLT